MPKTETADGEGLDGVQGHEGRERTAPDDAADPGGGADPEVETPRWRLSNWPLRYKLAVVMIIPLITALAFGSLRAVSELNEAAELNETVAQLEIAQQVTAVVQELQHERTMMVTSMSSGSIDDHAIQQQVERVNTAVKRLREFASTRDVGDEAIH